MKIIIRILVLFGLFISSSYCSTTYADEYSSFIADKEKQYEGYIYIDGISCDGSYCYSGEYRSYNSRAINHSSGYSGVCVRPSDPNTAYFCNKATYYIFVYENNGPFLSGYYRSKYIIYHGTDSSMALKENGVLVTAETIPVYSLYSSDCYAKSICFSKISCGEDKVYSSESHTCIPKPECSDGLGLDPSDNTCKKCGSIANRKARFQCLCNIYGYGDYVSDTINSAITITNEGGGNGSSGEYFSGEIRCTNNVITRKTFEDSGATEQQMNILFGMDDEEYDGGSTGSSSGSGSGSGSGGGSGTSDADCNKAVNALRQTYNSLASSTFSGVDCSAPEFSASKALYAGLKSALSAVNSACGGVPDEVRGIYDIASKYNLNCIDTGEVYKDPDEEGGGSSTDPGGSEGGTGTTVTEPGDNPGGESQEGGSSEGSETGGDGEGSEGGEGQGEGQGEEEGNGEGESESNELSGLFDQGIESANGLKEVYETALKTIESIQNGDFLLFDNGRVDSCPYLFRLDFSSANLGVLEANFDFCEIFSSAYGILYFLTFGLTLFIGIRWILSHLLHIGSAND